MAKNPNFHPCLSLIALFLLVSTPGPSSASDPDSDADAPTVYEILPKYGLPSGLLPGTVTNYTLNDDGRFIVELKGECYIKFDYMVYYEKTITGKLGYGSITQLKGIQVQRLFLWFDVDEIKVDLPPSDSIYFLVGFINKKLDVGQFKTVHSCRSSGFCGGSWKQILELPAPIDDVQMLLTE